MFILTNPKNGKELKIPNRLAKDVFGADGKFVCLPCDDKVRTNPSLLQVDIKRQKKKPKGTCVIRMGGLGDLILLSSGLRELKKRMGNTSLIFATLNVHKPFMESLGFIDKVINIDDLGHYQFDNTIDLRFSVEPPELGTHCKGTWESYTMEDRSDAFDKLIRVYPCPKKFVLPKNGRVTERMRNKVGEGFVLICASMVAPARSIIPSYIKPLCLKVLDGINDKVVLVGQSQKWNEGLRKISGDGIINLIDQTSIMEMIALCRLAGIVVTPDTGLLHVAGALGKRTIGVFGNINPRTRISYYRNVRTIYPHGEFSCVPCFDLHPCMDSGKPEKGSKCMRLSTPSVIVKAIEEVMN